MSTISPVYWRTSLALRTRLSILVAFLGLLPLIGVVLAFVALHTAWSDRAALDLATRGTIYLERINGLVYSVVMESRGIYMSPDWRTAEPFAQKLSTGLRELREAASSWKQNAIAAQRSNVVEMSGRIDHFVRFRTELARLAKEESTAIARTYGDNDANRFVRSELNQSLTALARAYEREVERIRRQIDTNDRNMLFSLMILAALAVIALTAGLLLIRNGLLKPLLSVKTSMIRLADGELDIDIAERRRSDEIGEMAHTVEVFQAAAIERRRLNRETRLLSELNEWLQSCKSLDELYRMVATFMARLLPDCAGSLYIYANSRDVLDRAKTWNGGAAAPAMQPDDCWGLRRGRVYTFGENEIDFACAHVGSEAPKEYCCIPILAHGETIGLMHLSLGCSDDAHNSTCCHTMRNEQRRLGLVCAEQISLAIANVKLRDQLRDQSIRDPLTGLFNRRYMLETCRREFSRALRAGQSVSILSIDVDHFKKFNDNHGHDAGDTVLRAVGECMTASFRDEDVPCRFGGEEFVVVLPGAELDDAARRAEQLRTKVEALSLRYLDTTLPRVAISIGVAAFPQSGATPQSVLKAADDALYRAKENGRNRVELSAAICSPAPVETGTQLSLHPHQEAQSRTTKGTMAA